MQNRREWLSRVLFESVLIVLSVLLALALDEWRQTRQQRATAEAALRSIAAELSSNRAQLEAKLPYYACLVQAFDSLTILQGASAPFDPGALPGWQGMSPPLIRSGSYEAAAQTGALSYMPFHTADALSQVYTVQSALQRIIDHAAGAMMSGDIDSLAQARVIFGSFGEVGREVAAVYDQVGPGLLRVHGYHPPESSPTRLAQCAPNPLS